MTIPLTEDYESSLISGHAHDPQTDTIAVRFRSTGETFHYSGASPELYQQFLASDSKGKFFHNVIKKNLSGVKQ